MTEAAVIGIDLGGTKLAGGIFNAKGKLLRKTVTALEGRKGAAVGKLMQQVVGDLLRHASGEGLKLRSIGISVPGISYAKTGCVWAPNIPGWKNYPLRREIESLVRNRRIHVQVESDRVCSILGEIWRGSAKGCRNAIFLAVGTGIGAGILVDGKILRGAHDIAGAAGWLALDHPFNRKYVQCGCFEYHASGQGLAKVANEFSIGRTRGKWTAHEVFSQYARGNIVARKVVNQAIEFWGMAVANFISLFNPEIIILGGGVFGPAGRFIKQIHSEAKKWAQPVAMKHVKLTASKLGSDAALYGAGYLALNT